MKNTIKSLSRYARLGIISMFLFSFLFSLELSAQDMIIKTNSDTIFCKIKEIGSDEIKYVRPEYSEDVIFGIDKEKVKKVIFANGEELSFTIDLEDPQSYAEDHKNAIKFNLFSPLLGTFVVNYEKSIKPGMSVEFGLGYIYGAGDDIGRKQDAGVNARVGFKFIRSPDFYIKKMKYSHILKGAYAKPEITFSSFNTNNNYYYGWGQQPTVTRYNVTAVAFVLNLGKQTVYSNAFLIYYYVGIGYGYSTDYEIGRYYNHSTSPSSEFPISFTAGMRLGFLFK